jgi:hypothetical protein
MSSKIAVIIIVCIPAIYITWDFVQNNLSDDTSTNHHNAQYVFSFDKLKENFSTTPVSLNSTPSQSLKRYSRHSEGERETETSSTQFRLIKPLYSANNTKELCANNQCVAPFKRYAKSMMSYAPNYKLANCAIPKSLSTISMAIFCFLYDSEWFIQEHMNIPDQSYGQRHCKGRNEKRRENFTLLNMTDWTHLAVVRHPLDRLISGFVDKCIKYGTVLITTSGYHEML